MKHKKIDVEIEVHVLEREEDTISRSILRDELLERLLDAGQDDDAFRVARDLADDIDKDTAFHSLVKAFAERGNIPQAQRAADLLGPYTYPAEGMVDIARISPTEENIRNARAAVSKLSLSRDSTPMATFFVDLFEITHDPEDAAEARRIAKYDEMNGSPSLAAGIYTELVRVTEREDDFAELARLAGKSDKEASSIFRDAIEMLSSWLDQKKINRIVESIPNAAQRAMAVKILREIRSKLN